MSYILYTICFKVTCLIGNCIALQAVNVAWRTFGTTATTSIHHPRGFQSAAAGAPGFLGHKMPQNGFTTSPNLSASLNHWEWRIHGGTDWQRVTESGDGSSQAQESPWCCKISLIVWKKKLNATWSSDQLMSPPKTWLAMARCGSLLLCLEAIGSHCVTDVPCTSGASNSFRISFSSSSGREQNAQNGV